MSFLLASPPGDITQPDRQLKLGPDEAAVVAGQIEPAPTTSPFRVHVNLHNKRAPLTNSGFGDTRLERRQVTIGCIA